MFLDWILLKKNSMFGCRAVDPHSVFADPGPAVFLNADPDPST